MHLDTHQLGLVIGLFANNQTVLIGAVIATGIFIGVNNTITTQAVMAVAPVERSVASSAYGFVRFIGGGLAPYFAGRMAERWGVDAPFYVGAASVVAAIAVLSTGHGCSGSPSRTRQRNWPDLSTAMTSRRPRRCPRNSAQPPDCLAGARWLPETVWLQPPADLPNYCLSRCLVCSADQIAESLS